MGSFNKRRVDFGSDREYDDYLEDVEDLSKLIRRFLDQEIC